MPSLSLADRQEMAKQTHTCEVCKQTIYKCYCREHDEFYFDGHADFCNQKETTHSTCTRVDDPRRPDYLMEFPERYFPH